MTATAQQFTAEERRQYIGCSELATILNLNPYQTRTQLYFEKIGEAEPFTGNAHTERGNRLEAIAAEYYTEQTGVKLRRHNDAIFSADYPHVRGHVDRLVVGEKRVVEIKCPSVASFRKMQREGLPNAYIIQAQAYLHLSNAETVTYCIFCADLWDMATFDVAYDRDIARKALQAGEDFWTLHVEPRIPPDDDAQAAIDAAALPSGGGAVTFRDDEPFLAKSAALREAIELKRDAEDLFETVKKEWIAAVEDAPGIYEAPGMRVHYTMRAGRTSFDKKGLAKAHPEIDLSQFEKTGSPYKEFRPYIIKGEQQ